jgi:translation initiation factor IF-1
MCRVTLERGDYVLVHLGGGTQRNYLRVLVGDRVLVQLAPYDPGRGRIVRKLKAAGG